MVHRPIQSVGLVGLLCALEISNAIPTYPANEITPISSPGTREQQRTFWHTYLTDAGLHFVRCEPG